ncbi:MAG: hypothetical protein HOB32_04255 [Nitrospina sp.]|mgnify:CR=1 FL=1|nr:hypothetical protein [Nitrospina sp.]
MTLFYRGTQWTFLKGLLGSIAILLTSNASAIPVGDAYETGQAEFQTSENFQPRNEVPPVFHPSLNPGSNDKFNEAHPIPDYIKKISKNKPYSTYYQQLLEVDPIDQVQSKIFDEQAFRSVQKIGVLGFENQTADPFKDKEAGRIIAEQVSRELQSMEDYFIIPPVKLNEDARIRIATQVPDNKTSQISSSHFENKPAVPVMPNSNNKVDAVMIGAVTKYIGSYRNRNGKIKKSFSSKVEFGSFLVSTRSGQVIWGSRFIGAQPIGLVSSGSKWLSKKQLSQRAIKKVLKAFRQNKNNLK